MAISHGLKSQRSSTESSLTSNLPSWLNGFPFLKLSSRSSWGKLRRVESVS